MAIIAVLALLVVGAINIARNAAKETQHRIDAKTLQTGLEAFFAQHKSYPNFGSSGAGPISFVSAAQQLNVKLASSTDDCGGDGGGYLFSNAVRQDSIGDYGKSGNYSIQPANSDCSDYLENDVIAGP